MDISVLRNSWVLDAGCGGGRWCYTFSEAGAHVVAFDAAYSSVVTTKLEVPDAHVIRASVLSPPMRPSSFDLVFCFGVLHHTSEPAGGFRSLASLVKRGGLIHVYVYGSKPPHDRILRFLYNLLPFSLRHLLSAGLSAITVMANRTVGIMPFSPWSHQHFDALSPAIASNHTEREVKGWFLRNGLTAKRVIPIGQVAAATYICKA